MNMRRLYSELLGGRPVRSYYRGADYFRRSVFGISGMPDGGWYPSGLAAFSVNDIEPLATAQSLIPRRMATF
jgi:hypothetical protein